MFLNDNSSEATLSFKNKSNIVSSDEVAFCNLLKAIRYKNIKNFSITIRLHPSEDANHKFWYNRYLNETTRLSNHMFFINDLKCHQFICGSDSMGMYYASKVSKVVITCANFNNVDCSIPHEGIISLKEWCGL